MDTNQEYYQAPYHAQVDYTQQNDIISPSYDHNSPSSYAAIGQPDSYSGYGAQEKASQISDIETELRSGRYVWYRRLVSLLIFCFFGLLIFSIVGIFALPNALIYWGFVVVCIWNMKHLVDEFKALQNLDYVKSEKAVQSMRVYNFAGPLLIVFTQFLCQQNVVLIILTLILHAGGFFIVISHAAHKVSNKLRARATLQQALEKSFES